MRTTATGSTATASHTTVTAAPTRALGAVAVLPLLLAGLLLVPFLAPSVATDERFGWLLVGGSLVLVLLSAAMASLHRASHLHLAHGVLAVRSWSLRPTTVRLDEVVDAYVTPPPCERGHRRCCNHEGIPTLHLVDRSGTDLAIRTGGWWSNEHMILTGLRLGLRGNPNVDPGRAWLLAPPAQISVP